MGTSSTPTPPNADAKGCGGCIASIVVFAVVGVLLMWGLGWFSPGGDTPTQPTKNYSEGTLSVKCENAIAPAKAANYTVVEVGTNLFTVSGQTTAGEHYYCQYQGGFDDAQLLDVNVGG